MKKLIVPVVLFVAFVATVVFWPVSRKGPEPIDYGRDTCSHCRMHLSEPGYAAEARDAAEKLLKFDDVGCLVACLGKGPLESLWVEDHATRAFVAVAAATLVKNEKLVTPMGSGVVAFADKNAAADFARTRGGRVVSFDELLGRSRPDGSPAR